MESSEAIQTAMRIISNTGQAVDPSGAGNLACHSPYSLHMLYVLLISVQYLEQNGTPNMGEGAKVLELMLEQQKWRWKIAGSYCMLALRLAFC